MRHPTWITLVLTLTACATWHPTPQGPVGTWHLSEFRLTADEPAYRPAATRFTLTLDPEGNASGEVACNSWRGRYDIVADELFLENAAVTREYCLIADRPTARLQQVYLTRLQAGGHLTFAGNALEMAFADGLRWRFERR